MGHCVDAVLFVFVATRSSIRSVAAPGVTKSTCEPALTMRLSTVCVNVSQTLAKLVFCYTLHRYYHSSRYLKHLTLLQEDSPRYVVSTAVASQADEVPQLPEDDAAHTAWLNHINGGNNHPCPPSGNPMTEHAVMQHMNRMHLADVNAVAHAFLQKTFHGCTWHLPTYPRKLQIVQLQQVAYTCHAC